MSLLLETLTDIELEDAQELTEDILKALLERKGDKARALMGRLAKKYEPELQAVFRYWQKTVFEKLPKLRLKDESITVEVLKNYEMALADLPLYNKLAAKYYNEKPKTAKELQDKFARKIAGLDSLSLRQKERLIEQVRERKALKVEKRHPGAVAPAVVVSVDPNPLQKLTGEMLEVGVVEGGKLAYRDRGEKAALFAIRHGEAIAWVNEQSFLFAEHTASKFTGQAHWRIIKTGLDEGLSMPHVEKVLREEFGELSKVAAERIARTATAQAVDYGTIEGYRDLGIQMAEVVGGPNPCDECLERINRGPQPLEEIMADPPTFHPRCECTVAAVY